MINLILATDSYKLTHWDQYPQGTETVYSYLEAREGADYPHTVFFGLQSIIMDYLMHRPVKYEHIAEADHIAKAHFGRDLFNKEGWEYICREHRGELPITIKAVPEGTPVPIGNVMMTIQNDDPKCWWLTNALESLLCHVWYPCTVATLSRSVKERIASFLEATGDSLDGLPFMLHDFGYRGASSHESAAIGGLAHLVNFKGTDTLPAMQLALKNYNANLESLAFSVPATEHSVMTSLGREGEWEQVKRAVDVNPGGVLSVVADSYNIYEFVNMIGKTEFKDKIMSRDGVFVVRPDSVTREHPTPGELVEWILKTLWNDFGGTTNTKGFKVLDPHVRVLWGDGLDPVKIEKILGRAQTAGFSAENLVFGMGGGLLQQVNRDTQRFAFKCSAQRRNGEWHDIFKDPIDSTKKSKKGRLELVVDDDGHYHTVQVREKEQQEARPDLLQTVLHRGIPFGKLTFDQVRENAEIKVPVAI